MRRPLRNIEIFSMSVLDMFASALGAFIMISVILFPHFNQFKLLKQTREKIDQIVEQLGKKMVEVSGAEETSRHRLEEIHNGSEFRTSLVACQQSAAACKAALTKTFLVVGIEWEQRCDVDLHVTDPEQREFYYFKKSFPDSDSKAELSLDMQDGPGMEVWQNPSAKAGDYKIKYWYRTDNCPALVSSSSSDAVVVKGWILDRSAGRRLLPEKQLTSAHANADVATVRVSDDGSATIQPAPGN